MNSVLKTTLLLALMTGMFMGVGYLIGGQQGMMIALGLGLMMNFASYWWSDKMVLRMQGAKQLDIAAYPQVERIVRELATRDQLPMPKLFFVDTPVPNAFATGRNARHAVVAVTRGIMEILSEQELKAVLAHELGHVKNNDMLVSTVAASIGGAISYLAQMAFFFGGNDEEGGGNPIAALAAMLLAPVAAMIIQMAISRSREFMADDHSAEMGNAHELASALKKLEAFKPGLKNHHQSPNEQATAHLMFMNLFNSEGLSSLFSTHPSTKARVDRLNRPR